MVLNVWSPKPAATTLRGNLLEMQILGLCSRLTEPETLGVGINHACSDKPSR